MNKVIAERKLLYCAQGSSDRKTLVVTSPNPFVGGVTASLIAADGQVRRVNAT